MYVIALIGIGLFLHGYVVLTYVAFRQNKAWGVAVLAVPFAQVFFSIYHWQKGKKPFYSFVFGFFLWFGTAVIFGQGPLDQYWLKQIGYVQSAVPLGLARDIDKKPLSLEERVKKKLSSKNAKVQNHTKQRIRQKLVNLNKAEPFYGRKVKVVLQGGKEYRAELKSVSTQSVTLQKVMGDGYVSFEIKRWNVKSVYLAN